MGFGKGGEIPVSPNLPITRRPLDLIRLMLASKFCWLYFAWLDYWCWIWWWVSNEVFCKQICVSGSVEIKNVIREHPDAFFGPVATTELFESTIFSANPLHIIRMSHGWAPCNWIDLFVLSQEMEERIRLAFLAVYIKIDPHLDLTLTTAQNSFSRLYKENTNNRVYPSLGLGNRWIDR